MLSIWYHGTNQALNTIRWNAFKNSTPFGILKWTFSEPSHDTHFLDLQLDVCNNKIVTQIFEKEQNLYSYLPPHFCHSPGVIYGSIYGEIKRIFETTSLPSDITRDVKKTLITGFDKVTMKIIQGTYFKRL